MMVENLWDFFSLELNRVTLSWLGAAISSVAVAAWSLIKLAAVRNNKRGEGQALSRQTKVLKMGVFGKNISIGGGVFFGERKSTWIAVFMIFAGFASLAVYWALAARESGADPVQIIEQHSFTNQQEANFYLRAAERYQEQEGSEVAGAVPVAALSGRWSSRWRRVGDAAWVSGEATMSVVGDEIHIEYQDRTGVYHVEATMLGDEVMMGRYKNLSNPHNSTLWIGFIQSTNSIRGFWEFGDWDFSRI